MVWEINMAGLEISQNRHLPCITKIIGIYGKNIYLHCKPSKVSLALQPEPLVNTSGRVDFSSPAWESAHAWNLILCLLIGWGMTFIFMVHLSFYAIPLLIYDVRYDITTIP